MTSDLLRPALALAAVLTVSACATSENPADGGLFSGIQGTAGGGYQARIDKAEAESATLGATADAVQEEADLTAAEIARNDAEIARLEGELTGLRARIRRQLSGLDALGKELSATERAHAERVLAATAPEARTDLEGSARVESLQGAIADAARLADQLAALGAT